MAEREPSELDRLIDDVARRMTAHEPPSTVRARVLVQLDESPRPRWAWRLAPTTPAMAALAILAVAAVAPLIVMVLHTSAPGGRSRATARATDVPEPPPRRSATAAVTAAAKGVTERTTSLAPARPPLVKPSPEELAWRARAIPALAQPETLQLENIQPETLTIPQLQVRPLVTEPLTTLPAAGAGAGPGTGPGTGH